MAKKIIIREGEIIDFQTIIEETVGDFLARSMDCYKDYHELTEKQKEITGDSIDAKSRAWFAADADYELIVIKKRRQG